MAVKNGSHFERRTEALLSAIGNKVLRKILLTKWAIMIYNKKISLSSRLVTWKREWCTGHVARREKTNAYRDGQPEDRVTLGNNSKFVLSMAGFEPSASNTVLVCYLKFKSRKPAPSCVQFSLCSIPSYCVSHEANNTSFFAHELNHLHGLKEALCLTWTMQSRFVFGRRPTASYHDRNIDCPDWIVSYLSSTSPGEWWIKIFKWITRVSLQIRA